MGSPSGKKPSGKNRESRVRFRQNRTGRRRQTDWTDRAHEAEDAATSENVVAKGDLSRRRGHIGQMESKGNLAVIHAAVPLKEMFGYSTAVRTLSSGRASYSMTPSHFEQVPANIVEEIINER